MKRLKFMKCFFYFFKAMIVAAIVFQIGACGKISDPKPYEQSGYPHTYPKI